MDNENNKTAPTAAPDAYAQMAGSAANPLLPCPFCGSTNIDPAGWSSQDDHGPACDDCGATAESSEDWNKRAAPTAAADGVMYAEVSRRADPKAYDATMAEIGEVLGRAADGGEKASICTCPSGDGSLRWPCPTHPPEQAGAIAELNAIIERQRAAPSPVVSLPSDGAAPAQAAGVDERPAFEAWVRSSNASDDTGGDYASQLLARTPDTHRSYDYVVTRIQCAWEAWQARAALAATPSEAAPVGRDRKVVSYQPDYSRPKPCPHMKADQTCDACRGSRDCIAPREYEMKPVYAASAPASPVVGQEDARDAKRYRAWRDNMLAEDESFINRMQDAMPPEVGGTRTPTAIEWDAAIDAAMSTAPASDPAPSDGGEVGKMPDTERLDFMAAGKCIIDHYPTADGKVRYSVSWPYLYEELGDTFDTPREAIDAARALASKETK